MIEAIEYGYLTGRQLGYYHSKIVAAFAGIEAQRKWNPRSLRSYHGEGDLDTIKELLFRLHPDDNKEAFYAFKYLQARARNLVEYDRHWRLIEDLAKELLERKTMTGEEIHAAVRASLNAQFGEFKLTLKGIE